jgi:hypothetical protein
VRLRDEKAAQAAKSIGTLVLCAIRLVTGCNHREP